MLNHFAKRFLLQKKDLMKLCMFQNIHRNWPSINRDIPINPNSYLNGLPPTDSLLAYVCLSLNYSVTNYKPVNLFAQAYNYSKHKISLHCDLTVQTISKTPFKKNDPYFIILLKLLMVIIRLYNIHYSFIICTAWLKFHVKIWLCECDCKNVYT